MLENDRKKFWEEKVKPVMDKAHQLRADFNINCLVLPEAKRKMTEYGEAHKKLYKVMKEYQQMIYK